MRNVNESKAGIYHAYDSVSCLMEQEVCAENMDQWQDTQNNHSGTRWFGVETAADVMECLRHGWPEGTQQMHEALGKVELPRLPSVRRKRKWADAGDDVCIHRVNSGRLSDAWRKTSRVATLASTGNHITIAVDVTCSGATHSSNAMWRGAAAVAIAEAAIESGRSVRIVMVWGSSNAYPGDDRNTYFSCEIKPYNADVSIDVLMTMLSLVGFYRLLGFKAYYCRPHKVCYGLGQCVDFDRQLLADGSKMIWVGRQNLSVENAQAVVKHAAQTMVERIDLDEYSRTA